MGQYGPGVYAAHSGGNKATNMHCLSGQPGLLPFDDYDEKELFARRQVIEMLPHIVPPALWQLANG
jgi:hypothetical protein